MVAKWLQKLVSREGFEPSTPGLKVRCSTTELPARLNNYSATAYRGQQIMRFSNWLSYVVMLNYHE